MKAILEFNLPEERVEHKLALEGAGYHSALFRFSEHLHRKLKTEEHGYKWEIYVELEKELTRIVEESNISLYDLE